MLEQKQKNTLSKLKNEGHLISGNLQNVCPMGTGVVNPLLSKAYPGTDPGYVPKLLPSHFINPF